MEYKIFNEEEEIVCSCECPICFKDLSDVFTEVPGTVSCDECKEEFEVREDSKYGDSLILLVEWTEENEKWGFMQYTNGLSREDEEAEIDKGSYEELTEDEKIDYRECESCDKIFKKYTGVCRLDETSGFYICKDCKRHQ